MLYIGVYIGGVCRCFLNIYSKNIISKKTS